MSPSAGPVGSVVTVRFGPAGNGCGSVTFEAAGGSRGGAQDLPFVGDSGSEAFLIPGVLGNPGPNPPVVPGRYVFSLTCDTTNNPATAMTVSVPFTVTTALPRKIVGIANTADGKGYWLVGNDGGVFSYGDAHFYGSLPSRGITPAAAIVGIAATHDHKGYWLVGADGGVFGFGDAHFYGSAAIQARAGVPVVGMAPTPHGKGYWLAGAEFSTFHFGDAKLIFLDSADLSRVNQPVVGIATTPRSPGVLGSDGRRRNLRLRLRALLRIHGRQAPHPTDRRHDQRPEDGRILGGGIRRRRVLVQRALSRLHREPPPERTRHRHPRNTLGTRLPTRRR